MIQAVDYFRLIVSYLFYYVSFICNELILVDKNIAIPFDKEIRRSLLNR